MVSNSIFVFLFPLSQNYFLEPINMPFLTFENYGQLYGYIAALQSRICSLLSLSVDKISAIREGKNP